MIWNRDVPFDYLVVYLYFYMLIWRPRRHKKRLVYVQLKWGVHWDIQIIFLFMLVYYRKFKLSTQIKYTFSASILWVFYEHFVCHFVNFFRQEINESVFFSKYIRVEKTYSFCKSNHQEYFPLGVTKCYLYWYKASVLFACFGTIRNAIEICLMRRLKHFKCFWRLHNIASYT